MTITPSDLTTILGALAVFLTALAGAIATVMNAMNKKVVTAVRDSTAAAQVSADAASAKLADVHAQTKVIELQGNSRWQAAMAKIEELQQEVRRLTSTQQK